MNRENDTDYYARRAAQERERARSASDAVIGGVHQMLAREYERRLQGDQARQ